MDPHRPVGIATGLRVVYISDILVSREHSGLYQGPTSLRTSEQKTLHATQPASTHPSNLCLLKKR